MCSPRQGVRFSARAASGRRVRAAPAPGVHIPAAGAHGPASPRNRGTYRARMPGNSASNGMPCCVTKWWVKWSVDRAVSGSGYGPVKLSRAGDDRGVVSGEPAFALGPDSVANGTGDLRVHPRTASDKQLSPGAPILWAGEPPGQSLPQPLSVPTTNSRSQSATVRIGSSRRPSRGTVTVRTGSPIFMRQPTPTDGACVTGSPYSTGEHTVRATRGSIVFVRCTEPLAWYSSHEK